MDGLIRTSEVAPGIWQLSDLLDNRAYLVVGAKSALLVDTMGGYGNLRAVVSGITDVPVRVVLTHNHQDHVTGAYGFGEVLISEEDDCCWEREREFAQQDFDRLTKEGKLAETDYWAPREGAWPKVGFVREGDVFDLGGRGVRAVALPGHTRGSMGYLVQDAGVLLLGDAVTPIMCLFFEESLPVESWVETLHKLEGLDFEVFYTGHHDVAFPKSKLASFEEAGRVALRGDGLTWYHTFLPYKGTVYMSYGRDANSPDFRAVIGPYVPRKRTGARRRRRHYL